MACLVVVSKVKDVATSAEQGMRVGADAIDGVSIAVEEIVKAAVVKALERGKRTVQAVDIREAIQTLLKK